MVLQGRAIWHVRSTIRPYRLRRDIRRLLIVVTMQAVNVLLAVDSVLETRLQSVTWKRVSKIVLVGRQSNLVG